MKGLFLIGVTSAAAFLVEINFRPVRAHATELREARCTKAVSVVAARDTSILMLARAKNDTVFAGGEERILSSSTFSGLRSLRASRLAFSDSFLLMTRNLRAFGQIMVADSFVGPGSDRVRAAFTRSGSRDIVVVPWSYGTACETSFWYGTARFATPDQQGFYVLQLRPDSLWVERRPTFDAFEAQLYSYAPGTSIPGPGKRFPGDTSTRRGPEPRQLFEMYVRS